MFNYLKTKYRSLLETTTELAVNSSNGPIGNIFLQTTMAIIFSVMFTIIAKNSLVVMLMLSNPLAVLYLLSLTVVVGLGGNYIATRINSKPIIYFNLYLYSALSSLTVISLVSHVVLSTNVVASAFISGVILGCIASIYGLLTNKDMTNLAIAGLIFTLAVPAYILSNRLLDLGLMAEMGSAFGIVAYFISILTETNDIKHYVDKNKIASDSYIVYRASTLYTFAVVLFLFLLHIFK